MIAHVADAQPVQLDQAKPMCQTEEPDELVTQRRALLQHLGLPLSHYLKLAPGSSTCVFNMRALLNASAICLMPDHLAYHWWATPAAPKMRPRPGLPNASAKDVGVQLGVQAEVRDGGKADMGTGQVRPRTEAKLRADPGSPLQDQALIMRSQQMDFPGQVEVKGSTSGDHSPVQKPSMAAPAHSTLHAQAMSWDTAPTPTSAEVNTSKGKDGSMSQDGGLKQGDRLGDPFGCSPTHVQLQVLASLRKLLQSKLGAIAGGSAQQDEVQAQQPDCTPAAHMALLYRANQKCIASAALHSLAAVVTEVIGDACCAVRGSPLQEEAVMGCGLQTHSGTADQVCPCSA